MFSSLENHVSVTIAKWQSSSLILSTNDSVFGPRDLALVLRKVTQVLGRSLLSVKAQFSSSRPRKLQILIDSELPPVRRGVSNSSNSLAVALAVPTKFPCFLAISSACSG